MTIKVTDAEMTSDVCSVHAVMITADAWVVGPADVFGPASRERLFTRDQATSAMVLGEVLHQGRAADPIRFDVLVGLYSGELGLAPAGTAWERHDDPEIGR